jgi:tetratricopeptide (TPR) repeat protein
MSRRTSRAKLKNQRERSPVAFGPAPAERGGSQGRRAARESASRNAWPGAIPAVLVGAGLAVYLNSFAGPFLLDDKGRIVQNPHIRSLWPPWDVVAHSTRPVVELSVALNYALGGLNPWGYHAFNLAVHLLAGLVLFGIVRRTLQSEKLRPRYGRPATWLALAVALIWLVHPLQTESVTYVIQRGESLMGLFYLLTLYCGIRGCHSLRPRAWFIAAVGACALGMGSKEVMVTAPILMLLYDRVFLAESLAEIWRRRRGLYLGLASTWLLLGFLLATSRVEEQNILVPGLTPWRYATAQFGVIVHYLRLAVWPHPLVLDYAWPLPVGASAVVPWAAVVAALAGGTVLAFRRVPWAGFCGAWFFLILAPSSSIVPIADLAFEHRMYLPLAAVVAVVVVGGYEALGRLPVGADLRRGVGAGLLVGAVAALGFATVRRNEDYRNELRMWTDTVARRPDNGRAHYNLGHALYQKGDLDDAMAHLKEAVRLTPDDAKSHIMLGLVLVARGQTEAGIAHYREAMRLDPKEPVAHFNLAVALASRGLVDEAITEYAETIRLEPRFMEAHNNLAVALAGRGRLKEAIAHFEEVVRLRPRYPEAYRNLGNALLTQGQAKEAIFNFEQALRLRPNFREALADLRRAQVSLGQAKGSP